ncbi:MAG: hypothetical protein Q9170_007701 [Blastenia crenularia]
MQTSNGLVSMSPMKDVTNSQLQATEISTEVTKQQPRAPLTLDKLPTEIQRNIYINLLKTDCVRQPPDEYLVRSYCFHTAILSVSKRIHEIASSILYQENCFVVISCNWEAIFETMTNHEVAIVCAERNLVARFKRHSMRLHVTFAWAYKGDHGNKAKSGVLKTFIIVHNDLQSFVRLLHILGLSNGGSMPAYKLALRVEKSTAPSPGLPFQKKLLEPFRQLKSLGESVKIFGFVDADYARSLQDDMMFPIRWTRAVAWQLYSLMVSIARAAEEARHLGNTDIAYAKYDDCGKVWEIACGHNPRFNSLEDRGFHRSCAMLTNVCHINIMLMALQNPAYQVAEGLQEIIKQTGAVDDMDGPIVTPLGTSKMYHYRGIAMAALGRDDKALLDFRKAIRLDAQNQILRRHLAIIKKRIGATSPADKLAAGNISVEGLQFMEIPDPIYAPSEYIAGERYLLRKFNYPGDMLPQITESKPTDIAEWEKTFKSLEAQKSSHPAGKPWAVWIGANDKEAQSFRRVGIDFGRVHAQNPNIPDCTPS